MTEHDLVACARCARHAFVVDGACPFCGAALPEPPPDRPRWLGPVTRAAIFYGASALASMGCSEPPPAAPPGPDHKTAAPREAHALAEEPTLAVIDDALPALLPEPIGVEEDEATRARERAHAEDGKSRLRAQATLQQNRRLQQQQLQQQQLQQQHVRVRQMPPYGAPAFDFVV